MGGFCWSPGPLGFALRQAQGRLSRDGRMRPSLRECFWRRGFSAAMGFRLTIPWQGRLLPCRVLVRLVPRSQSPIQQELAPMRHAVIVLAAVSCLSVFVHGQTADELVSKNIQAKGGIDKIKAIKFDPHNRASSLVAVASRPRPCRRTSVRTWCARRSRCRA